MAKLAAKPVRNIKLRWRKELRELWYDGTLIKRFRRPAPIAELILDAFQEQRWQRRIDDPLPPNHGRRESDRLRHEIQALNRRLAKRLIRFYMDGTGEGACWEPVMPK